MKRKTYITDLRSRGPLFFVIVAVSLGFSVGSFAGETYREEKSETIEFQGEKSISISVKKGNVTVTGEEDRNDIYYVFTKKVKGMEDEDARKLASLIDIVVERDGDELIIRTEIPKKAKERKNFLSYILQRGPKIILELNVIVPAGIDISVGSASGDITIADMTSMVRASAASGNMEILNIEGDLVLATASGDVMLEDVTGSVMLNVATGDVEGKNISGDVEIETASGNVELSGLEGDLTCRTSTGNLTVDGVGAVDFKGMSGSAKFLDVRGGVLASAASGDLSFRLVPESAVSYKAGTSSGDIMFRFVTVMPGGYLLKASTTTGEISANLPITIKKVGRNHIAGIVRDGKSKVILETASGDIAIYEPEE